MIKTYSLLILFALFLLACGDQQKPFTNDGKPITPMKEYTQANSREWQELAEEHLPVVERIADGRGEFVVIRVPLKNANEGHYIEKIGLMTKTLQDLEVKTMQRTRNPSLTAEFRLGLKNYPPQMKAFAKCNLHDLWTHSFNLSDL